MTGRRTTSTEDLEHRVAPEDRFDVIVIGGGPGGYVTAGRAGQLGLRTALVERAELGGVCLNWGCIPTKALLHGAEVARAVRAGAAVGILAEEPTIDVEALVRHSRTTAGQLSGGIGALMRARGVEVVHGSATVAGKGEVDVEDGKGVRHLEADHVIVATGSGPRGLPGIEPDGDRVWTYREALVPAEVPRSLVVVGSGAIGSEFASLYTDLGSRVTLLEALPHVLPGESEDVSAVVVRSMRRRGLTAEAGVRVDRAEVHDDGVTVRYTDAKGAAEEVTAERLLLAVGVRPSTSGMGLEELGVLDERGCVRVDDHGRTDVWGLYAIGDVTGGPCLAHKASTEALRCVDAIAGVEREAVPEGWRSWVPRCTYTSPEVASIGLTEEQARRAGRSVLAKPVRFAENGRAIGAASTEGFGRVLVDEDTHEILGASLVGDGVTELISMVSVAHAAGMDADLFIRSVIPHPTRGEVVRESVLAALGRPVDSV
ncbi:dihydrolipoyl dehydrogenase [Actinomyces radicidentis]|uniref:dihydrolipoyl dehydrogenase n=1 Tax=Actinomyces radicidentis TaxID=111015 RepID=UPI0026E0892E|nr:dihydrolipoyl dehydrogenase [Actinomyces radicidentis]